MNLSQVPEIINNSFICSSDFIQECQQICHNHIIKECTCQNNLLSIICDQEKVNSNVYIPSDFHIVMFILAGLCLIILCLLINNRKKNASLRVNEFDDQDVVNHQNYNSSSIYQTPSLDQDQSLKKKPDIPPDPGDDRNVRRVPPDLKKTLIRSPSTKRKKKKYASESYTGTGTTYGSMPSSIMQDDKIEQKKDTRISSSVQVTQEAIILANNSLKQLSNEQQITSNRLRSKTDPPSQQYGVIGLL